MKLFGLEIKSAKPVSVSSRKRAPIISVKEPRWQSELNATFYNTDGVQQPEPFQDFERAFIAHPMVYACVYAIMTRVAAVDFVGYVRKKNGELEKDKDVPELLEILERPNAYMSKTDLMEYLVMGLELTGAGYLSLEKGPTGALSELWPLIPSFMRPVSSATHFISGYTYEINGKNIKYASEEVLHFKYPRPFSLHYGQGSVEPGKTSILTDLLSMTWNKSFMKNSARPEGILMPKEGRILDPKAKERLRESWKKFQQGAENAGRTAVLDGGMEYKELTRSQKDMDFINQRKLSREEILSVFAVPPIAVGILENANYSNAQEQMRTFWHNKLIPTLRKISDTLTIRARQMTGDIDIVIKPDLTGVEALRINELARAETAQLYVTMGVPLNEVIEKLELPFDPVEGGDVPRAPAGTPAQEDDEDEDIEPAKSVRVKELKDAREQKRVKAWLEFDAKASRGQGRIETTMKNFFKGQEVRLIKGVTERLDQEKALGKKAHERAVEWLEVQFAVENEELTSKILPRIRSTYKSAGESAAKKRGASFNLLDPRAVEYLDDKRLRLAGQINRTTIDELKEAIQEGFEAGESIAKIADRLDEVYDFAESKRSERIARTESISASNGGTEEGMRQSGVSEKEWLSARDERVRDTHQKLDGNVVGVKEMFLSESGETLRFPGDPNADLSEIVNCRCTLIAAEEE